MSGFNYQSVDANVSTVKFNQINNNGGDALAGMESLLAGSLVSGYDAQIQDFTNELGGINAKKSALRQDGLQMDQLLGRCSKNTNGNYTKPSTGAAFDGNGLVVYPQDYLRFETLANSLGITLTDVPRHVDGVTSIITEDMIKSVKTAIENQVTDLNSVSELKLVNYQSLMDARKQAMLMLSNMVSSDNQTKMAIIQNMKS